MHKLSVNQLLKNAELLKAGAINIKEALPEVLVRAAIGAPLGVAMGGLGYLMAPSFGAKRDPKVSLKQVLLHHGILGSGIGAGIGVSKVLKNLPIEF